MANVDQLEELRSRAQATAYMYPEPGGPEPPLTEDVFFFQYWPQEIQDSYSTGYADKTIPGGSHPLEQFVGSTPRTISFTAFFTAEVLVDGIPSRGIPSERYTVDLVAARQRIRSFQHPNYRTGPQTGVAEAPPRLNLVFPNLVLGGDKDELLTTLRNSDFTITKCYPDGTPRIMAASLSFQQSVQFRAAEGSGIRFVGQDRFDRAKDYRYRHDDSNFIIGGAN